MKKTMRGRSGEVETDKSGVMGAAFGKAFNEERRLILGQAHEMLRSEDPEVRRCGRSTLLGIVLNGGSARALHILGRGCRDAITSQLPDERRHARSMLSQLAAKKDSKAAKKLLELDCDQAIADSDFDTLVYLGMNGKESVSRAADAGLEKQFEEIAGAKNLDTIAYIAAMSGCSLETKRKAAKIAAESEKRAGNLTYIHDANDDCEIKNMMNEALRRRF